MRHRLLSIKISSCFLRVPDCFLFVDISWRSSVSRSLLLTIGNSFDVSLSSQEDFYFFVLSIFYIKTSSSMFCLPIAVLIAVVLLIKSFVSGIVAPSPQTLLRRSPIPPTATYQALNTTQAFPSAGFCRHSANSPKTTITSAPSLDTSLPCLLNRPLPGCDTATTWDGPLIPELLEQCVLWNSSCCGDRKAIATEWFNDTRPFMEQKPCWKLMDNASIPCTQYESPGMLSAMREVKSWMRTPDCASMFHGRVGGIGCCGEGYIDAENADIYYWPEPDANTACLSIIGDKVNPWDYGATTDKGVTYWGCKAMEPKTLTTTSWIENPSRGLVSSVIMTVVETILTTAQMTTIGSVTFKQSLVSPWTTGACLKEVAASPESSASAKALTSQAITRINSLVVPYSMTSAGGLPVSTVVSGDFTL